MNEPVQYRIPAVNFPRLEDAIAKLNKRAAKLDKEPIRLNVVSKEQVVRRDEVMGFEYTNTVYVCTVEGESPRLHGWELVAIIKPVGEEENLVNEVPPHKCPPKYRTTEYICEHCGALRNRKAIFVLRNVETGVYKQVGRQCLQDFLGQESPAAMLARAENLIHLDTAARDAEGEGWGYSFKPLANLEHFVTVVAVLSRQLGYLSKNTAFQQGRPQDATAETAWLICVEAWGMRDFIRDHHLLAEQKDVDTAKAAIEWASKFGPDATSTYLHDLGVCCRQEYVAHDRIGYVGSVIDAYQRNRAEDLRGTGPSQHVGTVGQRREFSQVTIVHLKEVEGEWGVRTRVTFRDEAGNILLWWASGRPEWLEQGKVVNIRGTVVKHTDHKGVLQTQLKIVKVLE